MKTFVKGNWLSILAIIMLIFAVPSGLWPYSYYQFLRIAITLIAVWIAYSVYKSQDKTWTWIMGVVAVLFNPIIPFYFSKGTWAFLDLIVAVVFLASIFKIRIKHKELF